MNKFVINTTKKLNQKMFRNSSDTDINQIISVFKNHVSIRNIQEYFPNTKQITLILAGTWKKMDVYRKKIYFHSPRY